MSLPLGSSPVIDLGGKRWVLSGRKATPVSRLKDVAGAVVSISDFGGALQSSETVSAEKRHAEAIIEKQLRERGDSDGPSKVLIVDSHSVAGTTHALYTSVPADQFSEYWEEVSEQKDHCLLVPVLSLLYRRLLSLKTSSTALVFQCGQQLTFLTVKNGKPQHCLQVSSTGLLESDWQRAISFLVSEIRGLSDVVADKVEWHSWDESAKSVETTPCLETMFAEATDFSVSLAQQTTISTPDGEFSSSIPLLLKTLSLSDKVNSSGAITLFRLEQYLPWAAAVVLGVSAALHMLSGQWSAENETNKQSIASLSSQIDEQKLALMRREIGTNVQPLGALLGSENLSLLNMLSTTNSKPALPDIILSVRQSVPNVLRITGMRLDNFLPDVQLTIEGNAGRNLPEANSALELMIKTLRSKGYLVKDNGMFIKNKDNLFQLVLTLEGSRV